ncbi:ExeM/NucH family extracellular endonuclease [Sediminivirga luteola]|uniref:ExeM/NucH family extracellular endonuclease n=1 Tax=Sediminivirga luteola TaxID=1774748 RepID=A0A8J2XIV8_9MICO|nr:ExeM/NucH family extracellular endonuclease [Sediminivirga luteola]GGA04669.1 hypothetical protein GCM10011333_04030 [Sediminivirga luteola]
MPGSIPQGTGGVPPRTRKPILTAGAAAAATVLAVGFAPAATAATVPDLPDPAAITEIGYTLPADFIEVAADPGTDLSGWTVGSVTRGGSVQAADYLVTLPEGTQVGESGALAVEVQITNSVNSGAAADGSYGASAFVIDAEGTLHDFQQIGGVAGGRGVTGAAGGQTPAAVVGVEASPTGAVAASGESIQLVDGSWTSAAPTPGTLPGGPGAEPTEPPVEPGEVTAIAEIQGTGEESPLQGQTVTTRGVVTAAYPTGGLNGYFIQTPGTGGEEEREASDGIFVYSSATVNDVQTGQYVEVTGQVSEYYGQTQITVAAGGASVLDEAVEAPKPVASFPLTDEEREALEGMLLQPEDVFTVSDNYQANQYGELLLALGEEPLRQPTDVAPPLSDEALAVEAENAEREVILDDGSSWNYMNNSQAQGTPFPYLYPEASPRVGAQVSFTSPVVLGYGFDAWRFQPLEQLTGDNAEAAQPVLIEDTRQDAPLEVPGRITLASFNVLNYFITTGDQLDGCQYYNDREGNPVTVRGGCDARGAANAESFERQQAKIVEAINRMDTSVLSLEEIENSSRFDLDRDAALAQLVEALNEHAGEERWDYIRSPEQLPENDDVIRTAFIYQPAEVAPLGDSAAQIDDAFHNARAPLAQAFAPLDASGEPEEENAFLAIVNHFKSKGSGSGPGNEDTGDGQGASNADRVAQATALVSFAEELREELGTESVYLLGDFNSYTEEDPMQVFYEAGYHNIGQELTDKSTYVFSGRTGSLDHILALEGPARDAVQGADIWQINSVEAVAYEYSRYNYNVAELYAPDPFRASDHDPLIVGLFDGTEPGPSPEPTEPEPTTPAPTEPEPTTDPTEPEPTTDPTEPEPTTPAPTEPEPTTPAPTEPTTDPTEPEPTTDPTEPGTGIQVDVTSGHPGDPITVTGLEEYEGEELRGQFNSDPVDLGTATVDGGAVRFTVPEIDAGEHTFTVFQGETVVFSTPFEVLADDAPAEPALSVAPERVTPEAFVDPEQGVRATASGFTAGESVTFTVVPDGSDVTGLSETVEVNAEGVAEFVIYGDNPANPAVYVGSYTVGVEGTDLSASFEVAEDADPGQPGSGDGDGGSGSGGDNGSGGGGGSSLPRTGAELAGLGAGLALIAAGAAALCVSRRQNG